MENLSHTLVGIALADSSFSFLTKQFKKDGKFRTALLFLAFVSNSFPDLDYLPILMAKKYYLIHLIYHRSFTHFLCFVPLQAVLIVFGFSAISYFFRLKWTKGEYFAFFGACSAGLLLHILMDSFTVNGVHPFWPFDKTWIFNDTFSTVEPGLWVIFGPYLLFFVDNRWVRLLGGIACLLGFTFMISDSLSHLLFYVSFFAGFSLFHFASGTLNHSLRRTFFWLIIVCLLSFYKISGKRVAELLTARSDSSLVDVARSPFPANPFCWSALTVALLSQSEYQVSHYIVTPFPYFFDLSQCVESGAVASGASSYLVSSQTFSKNSLAFLRSRSCLIDEFLRYSRVPGTVSEQSRVSLFDLKHQGGHLGFGDILSLDETEILRQDYCMGIADWIWPRHDLL